MVSSVPANFPLSKINKSECDKHISRSSPPPPPPKKNVGAEIGNLIKTQEHKWGK